MLPSFLFCSSYPFWLRFLLPTKLIVIIQDILTLQILVNNIFFRQSNEPNGFYLKTTAGVFHKRGCKVVRLNPFNKDKPATRENFLVIMDQLSVHVHKERNTLCSSFCGFYLDSQCND